MKNIMDGFVEDDAKKMFRILKEEFLDGVVIAGLTQEEFNLVVSYTVSNKELIQILQDMYASGEYREYAKTAIVNAAIVNVLSRRKHVSQKEFDEGVETVLMKAV